MKLLSSLFITFFISFNCTAQNNFIQTLLKYPNYSDGEFTIKFKKYPLTYYFIIQDSIINKAIEGVNRKGKLKQYRNVKNNHFNDSTIIYGIKNRKSFIQIAKNDTLIKEVDTGFHFLTNKLYAVYVWDKIIDTNFHLISKEKLHHFYEFWNGYGNTPSINGVVTYYFKNSNIKKIVRITNSKRNGKVEFFNRKGQLRKIKIYKLGEKTEVIKIDK